MAGSAPGISGISHLSSTARTLCSSAAWSCRKVRSTASRSIDQVVVQHAGGQLRHQHVGLALQQQAHPHAAARGLGQVVQQAVAGKEIGVGDRSMYTINVTTSRYTR